MWLYFFFFIFAESSLFEIVIFAIFNQYSPSISLVFSPFHHYPILRKFDISESLSQYFFFIGFLENLIDVHRECQFLPENTVTLLIKNFGLAGEFERGCAKHLIKKGSNSYKLMESFSAMHSLIFSLCGFLLIFKVSDARLKIRVLI